jgi:hypothetical protein
MNTSCLMPFSILSSTSLIPKSPMIKGTSPMPSARVRLPYVKRGVAVMGSSPMVPRSMPASAIATARSFDPAVRYVTMVKPSSKRPKISGGPKDSATFVSGGASSMMPSTLAVPAMNDPNAAMPSAGPARPCSAIW